MTLAAQLRRTFAVLGVRNYRLYFTGQFVSVVGTWMQRVAQSWLVLELTGSGTAVGAVTALQFLPILLIAPAGGLVADRMEAQRSWRKGATYCSVQWIQQPDTRRVEERISPTRSSDLGQSTSSSSLGSFRTSRTTGRTQSLPAGSSVSAASAGS